MSDFIIIYHFSKLWLWERTMYQWTKGKVIRMERSWITLIYMYQRCSRFFVTRILFYCIISSRFLIASLCIALMSPVYHYIMSMPHWTCGITMLRDSSFPLLLFCFIPSFFFFQFFGLNKFNINLFFFFIFFLIYLKQFLWWLTNDKF